MSIVEKARRVDGCLAFAITAALRDPCRVNLFERWVSQAAVKPFRRRGPRMKSGAVMLWLSVAENDIAGVRRLFGKGRA